MYWNRKKNNLDSLADSWRNVIHGVSSKVKVLHFSILRKTPFYNLYFNIWVCYGIKKKCGLWIRMGHSCRTISIQDAMNLKKVLKNVFSLNSTILIFIWNVCKKRLSKNYLFYKGDPLEKLKIFGNFSAICRKKHIFLGQNVIVLCIEIAEILIKPRKKRWKIETLT